MNQVIQMIKLQVTTNSLPMEDVYFSKYIKGDKGDAFTYEDFTEEQITELQKPALDIAESLIDTNTIVNANEANRISNENQREVNEYNRVIRFDATITDSEAATALAKDVANHPTYIGTDNYVYKYDSLYQVYFKTNIYCKGEWEDLSEQEKQEIYTAIKEQIFIPTKTSELINDSNFITSTVSNLINYYTKDTTYNKIEVNNLISLIPKLTYEIVNTLPTENISSETIYLLAIEGTINNAYEEYLYINNHWEIIGSTQVDLTNYPTKGELNTLLENKVDKEVGKGLSSNDYTIVEKEQLATITQVTSFEWTGTYYRPTIIPPDFSKDIYQVVLAAFKQPNPFDNPMVKMGDKIYTLKINNQQPLTNRISAQEICYLWFLNDEARMFGLDSNRATIEEALLGVDQNKYITPETLQASHDVVRDISNNTSTYDIDGLDDNNTTFESGSSLKRFFSLIVYKFKRLSEVLTDLITSNNIIDVVQNKAALNNYNNSKVKVNDIIVVSSDETHNNAKSFYKWLGSTPQTRTWVYQFSEPILATKEELDNKVIIRRW